MTDERHRARKGRLLIGAGITLLAACERPPPFGAVGAWVIGDGEARRLLLADAGFRDERSRTRFTAFDLATRRRTGEGEIPDIDVRCNVEGGALLCSTSTSRYRVDPVTARVTAHDGAMPYYVGDTHGCGLTDSAPGWRIQHDQVLRDGQVAAGELAPGAPPPRTVQHGWFVSDGVTGEAILIDGAPIVGSGHDLTALDASGAVRWTLTIRCHAATQVNGQLVLATGQPGARVVILDGRTGAIAEVLRPE